MIGEMLMMICLVVSTYLSEKSWTSSLGMIKFPTVSGKSCHPFHGSSHHQAATNVGDNKPSSGPAHINCCGIRLPFPVMDG